ncbi:hypothetical protein TL16_g07871 [Triparma laevis f. inornata]|uniref:Carboxylic ester hydrolase n=1 Tax=Triparma laevis f. inornata TaxID=1714386 RepID=A0A9W7B005_9STRA|nr:hypothetical protein TL16_g07871 [Triparma laevis f. inornata]
MNAAHIGQASPQADAQTVFKGIRYTAQPTRFAPTSDPLSYDPTPAYDTWGNVCPQDTTLAPDPITPDEDCLFLNVFTPENMTGEEKLPVMFYIHGGGYTQGYSQQLSAERLAKEYGVVAVNVNYRLGALGFFADEELTKEHGASGGANGVIDQVTALKWVNENIAQFGGDPEQITIFGESAGGTSVCHLLSAPMAKGLYKRAIVESGPCVGPWGVRGAPSRMYEYGVAFKEQTGKNLDELKTMPVDQLMTDLSGQTYGFIDYDGMLFTDEKLTPERLTDGQINVDPADGIIIGSNSVDTLIMTPWDVIANVSLPVTQDQYYEGVMKILPGKTAYEALKGDYDMVNFNNDPTQAWQQMNADLCVICPTRTLANMLTSGVNEGRKVYQYSYNGAGDDGRASHAAELCELFVDYETEGVECTSIMAQEFDMDLAGIMQSYWSSFAEGGVPVGGDGDPVWDEFGVSGGNLLEIGLESKVVGKDEFARCDFWEGVSDVVKLEACFTAGVVTFK